MYLLSVILFLVLTEIMVDAIEDDEIKAEKEEAVFVWRGRFYMWPAVKCVS